MSLPVDVRLGCQFADREAAIRAAGERLVSTGFAAPGYAESLLAREATATTYLGQGLAIPHGRVEDKHLVRQTGLAVLQVPGGVAWGAPEQTVHLVVAIAADSDAHLEVLRRLTRLMMIPGRLEALARQDDAQAIVQALAGEGGPDALPALDEFALGRELVLAYPNGLHARPAGQWAALAQRFRARVRVRCGDRVVEAGSAAALLSLGAARNAHLRVSADGPDAAAALSALVGLIQRLGEEEQQQAQQSAARQRRAQGHAQVLGDWVPEAGLHLDGVAASPGLSIGTLLRVSSHEMTVVDQFRGVAREAADLDAAVAAARDQLGAMSGQARDAGRAEQAAIFAAQRALLEDAALLGAVGRAVVAGHGAAWAWRQALDTRVAEQRALPDATLAARAADLQDVGDRVLRLLTGAGEAPGAASWPDDAIVLADDLTPSFTAQMDPTRVRGFCTVRGGPTAHTAILARALGLPALVAVGPELMDAACASGQVAILDGHRGRLSVAPTPEALSQARERMALLARRQAEEIQTRLLPATTLDGHTVEVAANVNRADQVARALEAGAEGVGLMRTEFLFLERHQVPSEDEQYEALRAMVEALQGRPLVVRTLDIGGDKQVPHLGLPQEDNPFLGVRGARLTLRRDDLLVPQLRALYRAARHGPLQVMFPMISTVEEVRALRARMAQIRAELDAPEVPVGIMIEVPSAAVMADRLAAHVDFFSIGTNDLTQYTLAVDRQHPELAPLADSLHPAVLRLVAQTLAGARRHGRWVGVCGGLAGDPLGAALLVGLGVDELSMSVGDIGPVKSLLRAQRMDGLRQLAELALAADTADAVRQLGSQLRPAAEPEVLA